MLMKSLFFGLFCLFASLSAHAQIFSGLAEIEKAKKEGFYTFLASEEKFATPAWKAFLKKTGSVESGRSGAIIVSQARIPAISKDPVALLSLISEEKNKVKLFISIATGPDSYIQTGHEKYREATTWLEEFLQSLSLEENVRSEETKLNELKNSKIKFQRLAERHIRELDSNKRQTELLIKRLEETKVEKEKILANQEQTKLDQKATEEALIEQLKKVESAKQKIN
ncbi:MAG: hypothetical protein RL246_1909 [Bacteroidota bacterium]|jgi:hypothetical protein